MGWKTDLGGIKEGLGGWKWESCGPIPGVICYLLGPHEQDHKGDRLL